MLHRQCREVSVDSDEQQHMCGDQHGHFGDWHRCMTVFDGGACNYCWRDKAKPALDSQK